MKDSSCIHWKSEEDNSDRWLAFQNRKRNDRLNEKDTHHSRFSPAMPRTSFPDNLWKSPLFNALSPFSESHTVIDPVCCTPNGHRYSKCKIGMEQQCQANAKLQEIDYVRSKLRLLNTSEEEDHSTTRCRCTCLSSSRSAELSKLTTKLKHSKSRDKHSGDDL